MSGQAKSRYSIASFSTRSPGTLGTIEEGCGHLQAPLISNATGNVDFFQQRQIRFENNLRSRKESSWNSDKMTKETVFINSAGKAYAPIPQAYTGGQQLSGSGSTHSVDRQTEVETEAKAIHERYFGSIDRNRTRSNSRSSVSRSTSSASRPSSYHQQLSNVQQTSTCLDLMSPLMTSRIPVIYNQTQTKPNNETKTMTPPSGAQPMLLPIRPLSEFFTNPGRLSAFHPPINRSNTAGHYGGIQGNPVPNPSGSSCEMEHGTQEGQQSYEHEASSVPQRDGISAGLVQQIPSQPPSAHVRQSSRLGAFYGGNYAVSQTQNKNQFIPDAQNRFQPPPSTSSKKPFSDTFRHSYEDSSHSQFSNQTVFSYRTHLTPDNSSNIYQSPGVQYNEQSHCSVSNDPSDGANTYHRQMAYQPSIKCEVAVKSGREGSLPRTNTQQAHWVRTLQPSSAQNPIQHTSLAGATVFTFENLGDEQPDLVDVCYYQRSAGTYSNPEQRVTCTPQVPVNDSVEVPSNSWKTGFQTNANNVLFTAAPETPHTAHSENSGCNGNRLVPRSPVITRKKWSSSRSQLPTSTPQNAPRGNSLHEEQIHYSNDSHQLTLGAVQRSYTSLPRQKRQNEFKRNNTLESEYGHTFDTLRGFSYEELLQNEIEQLTNQLETEQQSAEKERLLVQDLQNELRSYSPDDYTKKLQEKLSNQNASMRNDLENLKESYDSQETYLAKIENLTLRVHQLEEENKKLSEASSTQKKSYEKCLDEVSQKVSTALTAQKRELIQQELEEEKQLREEAEARVKDLIDENESSRGRLEALHSQLSQLGQKSNRLISSLHKPTLSKTKKLQEKLSNQNASMRNDLENLKESYDSQETYLAKIENLTLRVHQLEEENKKLSEASSTQKKSYEKCLDEVSQKVSTALTAQKDLQAECRRLQELVKELETENQSIRLQLNQKLTEPPKENEASSNPEERWKIFDQLDASTNECKVLLERSPSSSHMDPNNFFQRGDVNMKTPENEPLNLSNTPSEETNPDEVVIARGTQSVNCDPRNSQSLVMDEFQIEQEETHMNSAAAISRVDDASPRQVFNTLEHSNSTNSADSAVGLHVSPLNQEVIDQRAPPIPLRPYETITSKSRPVHLSHVSMRLSNSSQDPKDALPVAQRPASQTNTGGSNRRNWCAGMIEQPLVRSSHIGSVLYDKKLASSRQGSQIKVGIVTPRQTSFEESTDSRGQISGTDCENIHEEVVEELYDFLPIDPSISSKPNHGRRATATIQEPDYLEPKPSRNQTENVPKSPQTRSSRNYSPQIPKRKPLLSKEKPQPAITPNNQKTRIPGFSPNRVINSSRGMQPTNEIVDIDRKEDTFDSDSRAKIIPRSRIGQPLSTKNFARSPSQESHSSNNQPVDIWERKQDVTSQVQQAQHINCPRHVHSRLQRSPSKQIPPELPPNHPTTPIANRRQVVTQPDNVNDNSGRSNSSSSNEANQRFDRIMDHPDPRIREIAMKYSSPPMSPTFGGNPEEDKMSHDHLTASLFGPSIYSYNDKKHSKQNKAKQSSIPVKNIKQMNPKDMKTPIYHASSDCSEPSSKNKKSLKLKIPSLLKKHSGHHFSKPPFSNSKKSPASPPPVVTGSVNVESVPPEVPVSPRMIRKPDIMYNHLVDPRYSFSAATPEDNFMRSPVIPRRNDESKFQVSSMRYPSDPSGGDETIGDSSTLVNMMSDQEENQSENEISQQNSLPENEYDKIATTDDESLNGTGENDPVEEEERVQPGRGEGTTMSDSAEGDEVDGFDSRAAFLENWIENQNTTSATSSEDDNGPLFGSSASRDQLDPTIVERMKKTAVKKRSNVKDVDFGHRFGVEENKVLEQFNFLHNSHSPPQPLDENQEGATQVSYNTADFSTFTTCTGISKEEAYFSDSLCNDGSVNNFDKSESEQTLPEAESHSYVVLDNESHHTNIYEQTFPSTPQISFNS